MAFSTVLKRKLGFGHARFKRQEPALRCIAAAVAHKRAVAADHTVARHNDRKGILPDGGTHGSCGAWAADHALEVDFAAQFALNAFGAAAFFWASLRLFFGRRGRVRAEAAAAVLLGGPVAEALSVLFLPGPLGADWFGWYALLCSGSLLALWVILRSRQSLNTNGGN